VSPTAWMNLVYVVAMVFPFIVLGAICRWFWKARHDT
jgi:hypothetical protein